MLIAYNISIAWYSITCVGGNLQLFTCPSSIGGCNAKTKKKVPTFSVNYNNLKKVYAICILPYIDNNNKLTDPS